jgi:hypothetical protein
MRRVIRLPVELTYPTTTLPPMDRAGFVGNGGSVVFNNIKASRAGTYNMNFLYFNGDPSRPASISVNGDPAT